MPLPFSPTMKHPDSAAESSCEEFLDVKRACHFWLMENNPAYRSEQKFLPARVKFADWDRDVDIRNIKDLRSRKKLK